MRGKTSRQRTARMGNTGERTATWRGPPIARGQRPSGDRRDDLASNGLNGLYAPQNLTKQKTKENARRWAVPFDADQTEAGEKDNKQGAVKYLLADQAGLPASSDTVTE